MTQLDTLHPIVEKIINNIEKLMVGKRKETILTLTALLAEGHVLLEDVPGVGKTMLVRALSKSIDADYKRIQFTPDLLPSDVTGVSIYNPKELQFEFKPGPIMGNFVLADEINRTSPKTQSALLESMEEGSITIDGITRLLPKPFFVMATQNPVEYEGTYPLPEAQLDRFLLKLKMGYPTPEEEFEILNRMEKTNPLSRLQAIITIEELLKLQLCTREVCIDKEIKHYIVKLVTQTRSYNSIQLGASPRGSIALMKASQAFAFIHGRNYVIPDDVKFLAPYVLAHRLILKMEAKFEGITGEKVIAKIVARTSVPTQRTMNL
ncbi:MULTISPECIES: MoxR family ATPase [unclassified Bacillus (in: firmicutes)]|uniref:AAA family ATPase n=1 Tax=unclassified Bacillus (in: firmicutes) TaxID=185979 RepID=UPI0008E3514C|nr:MULTISPECIES: MoxR family ATPase [unclassified Bacillus (in: firmicutes)]SFI71999.1 MoxR-like ATPase [Bacillus sp. 71mf]SFS88866.1 MoxR-like ATPase [Bacillus sp. 103mf]